MPITVTQDVISPTVHMLVPVQAGLLFEVAWTGYDAGAGIVGFDVEYQVDGQNWIPWLLDTLDTEATFVGEAGHSYTFRVTATDQVGNVGQDEASVEEYSITKYYNFNGQRVAMQRCGENGCGEAIYLHGDHLGCEPDDGCRWRPDITGAVLTLWAGKVEWGDGDADKIFAHRTTERRVRSDGLSCSILLFLSV